MKKCFLSAIILCVILSASALVCLAEDKPQAPEFAGEFFGQHVPIGNYYFAKRVVMSFSAGWRGTPEDEKQLEDMVWQELLFSFEAFRRNIAATSEEIDTEIEKILKSNNVEFSFRVDKEKFQEWAQSTLGVDVETFRNQVEHLIKLEKLRKEALNSSDPQVTEEEAFQKFLDEYNTLLVELKQFDEKADAEKFYQEAIKPVPEQGLELLIWKDLLLSYEVFRRKIDITEEETDKEIEKTLREMEAQVRWKDDKEAYKKWLDENLGISEEAFKKLIKNLAKIDKLVQKAALKEEPGIDEDKTYEKFLNEYKSIPLAYWNFLNIYAKDNEDILTFEALAAAKDFYQRIKREAGFWDDRKREDPKEFKRPGFVALDFLLNMWGFDRKAAYEMLDKELNTYYPPATIYKGYGVFKILKIRKADPAEFEKRKEYYYGRVKEIKKYKQYNDWVEKLKAEANIKRYIQ